MKQTVIYQLYLPEDLMVKFITIFQGNDLTQDLEKLTNETYPSLNIPYQVSSDKESRLFNLYFSVEDKDDVFINSVKQVFKDFEDELKIHDTMAKIAMVIVPGEKLELSKYTQYAADYRSIHHYSKSELSEINKEKVRRVHEIVSNAEECNINLVLDMVYDVMMTSTLFKK